MRCGRLEIHFHLTNEDLFLFVSAVFLPSTASWSMGSNGIIHVP
jgi:hypothetical protein